MQTVDELIRRRVGDHRIGLRFEDRSWTHDEVVQRAADRAAVLERLRRPGPFHVALLLENVPEYVFWLSAAALVGAVVVGGNPTHRGDELARDLSHTECQLLVTDASLFELVRGRDLGVTLPPDRILVIDSPTGDLVRPGEEGGGGGAVGGSTAGGGCGAVGGSAEGGGCGAVGGSAAGGMSTYGRLLASASGSPLPDPRHTDIQADTLGLLLFTSGTSGAPKACRCTQGRLARIGGIVAQMFSLGEEDVCYIPMPLFHSNALMAGWAPALAAGATVALRERFSASQFLTDVRTFGATYFNYVGKPLSYILATPVHPDDADNPLRQVFGNEAAASDVARFAERFGCAVQDAYGSTEGGASITRTPDTPRGALGRALPGTMIVDPATGAECPRARFDEAGRLLNAEEAIGEIVSETGGTGFEGYWHNDAAEHARLRNGWYWTGDLGYRDEDDFFYFAGRNSDWLRVDGENFATAPVEGILLRHPDVVLASVYAVPDPAVGDQVMAALQLTEGTTFDPGAFRAFLAAQDDLGTKWAPRFVRVATQLPVTATSKVLTRVLRAERWNCADPVWWQPERGGDYRPLTPDDAASLDAAVVGAPAGVAASRS